MMIMESFLLVNYGRNLGLTFQVFSTVCFQISPMFPTPSQSLTLMVRPGEGQKGSRHNCSPGCASPNWALPFYIMSISFSLSQCNDSYNDGHRPLLVSYSCGQTRGHCLDTIYTDSTDEDSGRCVAGQEVGGSVIKHCSPTLRFTCCTQGSTTEFHAMSI